MGENNKENEDIYLKLKRENWMNFFRVWYGKKNAIELVDGSSLGNFSALFQELESQFRDKTGFKGSFYDLLERKEKNKSETKYDFFEVE